MAISTIESITSLSVRVRRAAERSGERLDHSPEHSGFLRYLSERYLIKKKILTFILRSLRPPLPIGVMSGCGGFRAGADEALHWRSPPESPES
jgi:hypothetical protein